MARWRYEVCMADGSRFYCERDGEAAYEWLEEIKGGFAVFEDADLPSVKVMVNVAQVAYIEAREIWRKG